MIFDLPRFVMLSFLFVIGCCIGSFLNVCIHRFPSKQKLWDQLKALNSHGSGCPRCASQILWRHNIPLFGWLILRGKCRSCKRPISIRYPLIELLTGVLFVAVYQVEMPTSFWGDISNFGVFSPDGPQTITHLSPTATWLHIRYVFHVAMICCLIVATFIDFELRIIPDGCTVPMMLTALIVSAASGQVFLVPLWYQDASVVASLHRASPEWLHPLIFSWDYLPFANAHPHLHGFLVSLAGLVVGGGIVWLVRLAGFMVLKQEAMGFGDVVLMAMVGSVIGWQPVTVAFFIAPAPAILAALYGWIVKRDRELPYGPWLSVGTLMVLLAWKWIWPLTERFFDMGPFVPLFAIAMFVSLLVSLQLVQVGKKMLGFSTAPFDSTVEEGWSSADHLSFYNSERPDEQTGQWNRPLWPGSRAGQGGSNYHRWRHGG